MDLVLLHGATLTSSDKEFCFNPYFNGSSTSTFIPKHYNTIAYIVSILILMDLVLLRYYENLHRFKFRKVSILILMDLVLLRGAIMKVMSDNDLFQSLF